MGGCRSVITKVVTDEMAEKWSLAHPWQNSIELICSGWIGQERTPTSQGANRNGYPRERPFLTQSTSPKS